MAILRLEDGTTYTSLEDIAATLAKLGVQLSYWPIGDNVRIKQLLTQDALDEAEKTEVLEGLNQYFLQLQQSEGYQTQDLIVLNPNIPNLDTILAKFDRCHTHADPEVRYIIDGEGIFGFVLPDGGQIELTIQPEEYINVPAEVEHWFYLTPSKRIKAIRYFTTTEGWTPEYTNTSVRMAKETAVV